MQRALVTMLIGSTALAVVGCSFAPMRALKQLKDAIADRNESEVAALVDFTSVRRNAEARVAERLEQANEGRLLGGVRAAIGERLADRVIEKLATPRGMIGMACDGSLREPPSPPPACTLKGDLVDRAAEGDTGYRARLMLADGRQLDIVLEQQSDRQWRVIDLVMTPESFEQLRKSIAN